MEIRDSKLEDKTGIIKVLKASLGEKELPISEEIWNFKHFRNPFGKSVVLVAVEGDEIIGVRAFMKWRWNLGSKNLCCFRAVDTATHPEHQGKGVFKNLTLKAIEKVKLLDGSFIFNTPNDQSRPGYVKMGWKSAGKLKVGLAPVFSSFFRRSTGDTSISSKKCSRSETESLCKKWNQVLENKSALYTPKSAEYLSWRYEENPLQNYEIFSTQHFYLAAYIKIRGKIRELRVVECIYIDPSHIKEIRKILKEWSSKLGAQVISFSPIIETTTSPAFVARIGPILTVKELNFPGNFESSALQISNWNYSLGDLELF